VAHCDLQLINFGITTEIKGQAMCLTDATNLIAYDPKDKKQKAALSELKKKMVERKEFMERKLKDIDRALKKIDKCLSSS
jgi:hypothetical protein